MTTLEKMIVLMKFGKFSHIPEVGFSFEINVGLHPYFNQINDSSPSSNSLIDLVDSLFSYISQDVTA